MSQADEYDITTLDDPGGQKLFRLLHEGANLCPELFGQDGLETLDHLEAKYDELSAGGRNEEAVEVAQQLVWVSMQFLPVNPESASELVTDNLERLSVALSRGGRHEKAVLARHSAICHYRTLMLQRPEPESLVLLVLGLINQSQDLLMNEKPALALSALRQAKEYNSVLARQDADISAELEGQRLECLANTLFWMKDVSAALDAGKAAAEHYRRLVASGLVRFRQDLARNLINLSATLRSVGSFSEGKDNAEEAVDLLRHLVNEDPNHHQLDLAHSLHNLACAWLRLPPNLVSEGSLFKHIADPLTEEEVAQSRHASRECGAILLRCRHGADPYKWVMLARATAIRLDRAEDLRNWHLPLLDQLAEYRELAIEPRHADLFLELQGLVAQCAWRMLSNLLPAEDALLDHGVSVLVSAFHSPDLTRWREGVDREGRSMTEMAYLTRDIMAFEQLWANRVMRPDQANGGIWAARRQRRKTGVDRTYQLSEMVDEAEDKVRKLRKDRKRLRGDLTGGGVGAPGRSDVLDVVALRKLAGFEQGGALLCLLELSLFSHPFIVGALVHTDGRRTQLLDFDGLHDTLVKLLNYEPLGNRGTVVRQAGVPKLRGPKSDVQEKHSTSAQDLRDELSSKFWSVLDEALSSSGYVSRMLVHVCSHGLLQQLPLGMRGSQDSLVAQFSHWPGLPYLRMAAESAASFAEPATERWLIGHDCDRDGRIAFLPMTAVEASLLDRLVKEHKRPVQRITSARQINNHAAAVVLCCHGDTAGDSHFSRNLVFGEEALSVREIVERRIGPPFALLPVCHGGDTSEDSAGNALGIASAFLLAGSRVVVASSKAVPDALMPWLSTLIVWHVLKGLPTHEAAHLGLEQFAESQFPQEYRTWLKSALPEALKDIQPGGAEYELAGESGRAAIRALAQKWPWDGDTSAMFHEDEVRRERCTRALAEKVLTPGAGEAGRLRTIMREMAAFVFVYGTHLHQGDASR